MYNLMVNLEEIYTTVQIYTNPGIYALWLANLWAFQCSFCRLVPRSFKQIKFEVYRICFTQDKAKYKRTENQPNLEESKL